MTAILRAALVALYTANTSFPSTLIVAIPYPLPREAERIKAGSFISGKDCVGM